MTRLLAIAILAMTTTLTSAWAQRDGLPELFGNEQEENWAQCRSGTPDMVIKGCTAVIDANEDPPSDLALAFNNRGNALYSKGEFDRAIEDLNEAIRRRPGYARAFNNRGNAYTGKKEFDRAIGDFTEAIGIEPDSSVSPNDPSPFNPATAYNNRGIAFFHKNQYNLAIMDFDAAIRMQPEYADAIYDRAVAFQSMGDYDRAMDDLNKSIQINPRNAVALYLRSMARRRTGDQAGAETDRAAALAIDPDAAGKAVSLVSASQAVAADTAHPGSPTQSSQQAANANFPPLCGEPAGDAPIPSYVDDSQEQLKKAVPALRGIRFESGQNASEGASASPVQDQTVPILNQSGALIADLLHRMPNLIAREEVRQSVEGAQFSSTSTSVGKRGQQLSVQSVPVMQYRTTVYNYRIVPKKDSDSEDALVEFRTDERDQPIFGSTSKPDNPRSIGFATSWLLFVPDNLKESRFRYVGQQKVGGHETDVLAFAQIPEKTHLTTVVAGVNSSCSTFIQGILWIDQGTFQIVRLQTDLLSPLPSIQMSELRSVLNYSEVKIPERDLSLWLPSDVETTWQAAGKQGDEVHRYSHYRLFGSTVRILPAEENPSP
jgi:tetratricopeptide (TPR) repeat protein